VAAVAIIVEFETLAGHEDHFTRLISEHARLTLQEEPGCLRFEVIKPVNRDGTPVPNKVMVNELFEDMSAVDAHERNLRMGPLQEAIGPLLASRRLTHATVAPLVGS
jgi:(4S)-4-hydroxy-5-phosphonooxypentane-2,3-dione isomerase